MSKRRTQKGETDPLDEGDTLRIAELESHLRATKTMLGLSDAKLHAALDVGRLGSWEHDLTTGAVKGNAVFKICLGLSPTASLTYAELQAIFHPDDVVRINQAIAYSIKTKTDFQIEHRLVKPDGQINRAILRGTALFNGDEPIRIMGILQDVTERERKKEEIALAQRRQEFLLKLHDQIAMEEDPALILEYIVRGLALYLQVDSVGYGEVSEKLGAIVVEKEWSRGLFSNEGHVEPMGQAPAHVVQSLIAGKPSIIEDVAFDPTVDAFYSSVNIKAILTVPLMKGERLIGLFYASTSRPRPWSSDEVALVIDVAERTWIAVERARAERKLRETETRFKIIAESLPALVWILNPNIELIYTNERWVKYSGLNPEQALGHSWTRAIHPDDWARMEIDLQEVVPNHLPYEAEARYLSATGEYRWHLIQGAPVHSDTGEFEGWVGTSVDIHDLKMTEAALRTSESQFLLTLRAAKLGNWSWKADSSQIQLSDRATEILGLPAGSSITRGKLHEQVHPADRSRVLATIQKAIEKREQYYVAYRILRSADKPYTWITAQGQPLYASDGTFIGTTGVFQDITERKHAEERQQLLIRELHHRVKNTLATVQAIVGSTARTATSIDDFYQGFVGRIVSLARTHNLLTEDLWQKADLRELVETELGPYEDEARNRVLIDGPPVELPSEAAVPIGMAMHELTTNAAKHGALSTFGGQVEVRWRIEPGPERPGLHFTWIEHGGPRVTAPARQGFGSRLLQRVLTTQLQAQVKMEFQEHGLEFTMTMPIPGEPPLFNPDK
ncbi:PAS domain-containing protein [Microvirga sp. ACRRW]|uniref:PAS domain-containing protein n=1 Tax=Microvirga sp. ACRRW TaxID=2918205 RepID=UPI001EF720BA|nr:PAS domain-containing protein [Microvirga sp. ACRRW]MCG7392525.1 PAS domain-containing protein [Microvirga sp. ACRRW]